MVGKRRLRVELREQLHTSSNSSGRKLAGRMPWVGSVGCTARDSWTRTVVDTEGTERCSAGERSGSPELTVSQSRRLGTAGTEPVVGLDRIEAGIAEHKVTASAAAAAEQRCKSCHRQACKLVRIGAEPEPLADRSFASIVSCSCRGIERRAAAEPRMTIGTGSGTAACSRSHAEEPWWKASGSWAEAGTARCRTADRLAGRRERTGCCCRR